MIVSFMISIRHNLKPTFAVRCLCFILLIPKATLNMGSSRENGVYLNNHVDTSAIQAAIRKNPPPPVKLTIDSERNFGHLDGASDYPSMDTQENPDYSVMDSEKNPDHVSMDSENNPVHPNPHPVKLTIDSERNSGHPDLASDHPSMDSPINLDYSVKDSEKNPDHLNMDSEKNPVYPNMDSEKLDSGKNPLYPKMDSEKLDSGKNLDPSMTSEKNSDHKIQRMDSSEIKLLNPFIPEITRVRDEDEEDMIDLKNISRKKKFWWFEYGEDESGEARYRTLHGKDYNPYDFEEHDKLNLNQYEDKLVSKIGPKKEKVETKSEVKPASSNSKVDENPAEQTTSDLKNSEKPSPPADEQMPNDLSKNDVKPANIKGLTEEKTIKESIPDGDEALKNSEIPETELSQSSPKPQHQTEQSSTKPQHQTEQSSIKPQHQTEEYQVKSKRPKKVKKKKDRGRKVEDSLMLEFAHNRPDSRILWLNYADYRLTDEYRLIDEAAERTFITARDYGFVNTNPDALKVAGRFITYVENNKIGYEVMNGLITPEWNDKPPEVRAATCKYLVNDNMMLRKYEFIYDSSQSPKQIQAHEVIVLLQMDEIQPRRIGALSCPVIQPNTSLVVTLFMTPITYVDEDKDEYVFTFIEEDPFNYPLYVRLMFLSRLANGDSVEDEFIEDQRINDIDELWWYGNLKKNNPKPPPKGEKSTTKGEELISQK